MNVEQLPSRYFMKDGQHCVEYKFRTIRTHGFTKVATLWVQAFDTKSVNINEDQTEATYFEYSDERATKYSSRDLQFIFEDLVYDKKFLLHKTEVPEKYLVESYK